MKVVLKSWFERYLTDPEAVLLAILLILAVIFISTTLTVLAPVFAGLVIAYLLEGLVKRLERKNIPHWIAVSCIYVLFMGVLAILLIWIAPLFFKQLTSFIQELPSMLNSTLGSLNRLPEKYPEYISHENLHQVFREIKQSSARFGQKILSFSLSSIPSLFTILIYVILVPFLVFFFLLDRDKLIHWLTKFLPEKRQAITTIWRQVDLQLGKYVRGKVLEIIIVTLAIYIPLLWFKIPYAFLLSVLVGLSVLVPFIGVAIVTVPVIIVTYLQWGFSANFIWIMSIYTIICILDANVLVPILFAEAVNLHPIAIITAILFFGSLWGFWGVFFAIPLASFSQVIIQAWPRSEKHIET